MTSRAFAPLAALTLLASLLAIPLATAAGPSISDTNGVTPASGTTNGGTVLTITGTNFAAGAIVELVDTQGTYTMTGISVEATKITATTPAHPTPGKVNVVVVNPDGSQATSAQGYTYTASPAPSLSGFSLTEGRSAGNANGNDFVRLTGSGFSTGIPPRVVFGTSLASGQQATVIPPVQDGSITVLSPPSNGLPAGQSINIYLQNPDGSTPASLTGSNGFVYLAQPAPTLASVTPLNGPSNGGTTLTLAGTGFAPGAAVTFLSHANNAIQAPAASVVFVSSTQLNVVSPAITDATGCASSPCTLPTSGTGIDVKVVNPDGQPVLLQPAFGYSNAAIPTITSTSVAGGPAIGGTTVTVTGSGFAAGPRLQVLFGGVPATNVNWLSSSQVTAVTPPCGTCSAAHTLVNVQVQNPDGKTSAASAQFNYTTVMRIDSIQAGPTGVPAPAGGAIVGTDGRPLVAPTADLFLNGAGFPSSCRVLVGTQEATGVNCRSSTQVSFKAPPGLSSTRDVTVVGGAGTDGRAAVLQGGISYVLAAPPTISGLSVTTAGSNGATANGPALTVISGSGFIPQLDGTGAIVWPTVFFGSNRATITAASATSLTVQVPAVAASTVPGTPAGLPVDVKVTNQDGQAALLAKASTSPTPFHYSHDPQPQLTSTCSTTLDTCPSGGTVGGASFTLTGNNLVVGTKVNFGTGLSTTAVACPATPTETCVNSAGTGLTVFAPPSTSATTVALSVANPDAQTFTPPSGSPMSFKYQDTPAPSVSGVSPSTVPANGGAVVVSTVGSTLTYGKAFSVTIDTTVIPACDASTPPAPYCIAPGDVSGNSVTVLAPGHATAVTVAVKVTNSDGKSSQPSSQATLTYSATTPPSAAPQPVSPHNGVLGTVVTVTGSNFAENARLPTVTVGGVAATVCTGTDAPVPGCKAPVGGATDQLSFVVPALTTAGPQTIVVTNPDGGSVSIGGGFRSLALPTALSVSPNSDTVNGGKQVTFTGTGFNKDAAPLLALFGTPPVLGSAFAVTDSTHATAVVPVGPPQGVTSLYLVDQDGQAVTMRNAFTYNAALRPSFGALTPPLASVNGGAQVKVDGTGFAPGAQVCLRPIGHTTVSGGLASPACKSAGTPQEMEGLITAPVTVTPPSTSGTTSLTFVVPSHAPGVVDVVISNPSGAPADTLLLPGAESRFAYTQVPGPTIQSVSPSSGDVAGGTTVTITGTNFASGANVYFNGTAATDVSVTSPTTITAKSPAGSGTVGVTVSVAGLAYTAPNAFSYTGTTTTTTTPTGTNTNPGTQSNTGTTTRTTTTPPTQATPPTTQQVIDANRAITVKVTRDGNDNVVAFTLPNALPAAPAGVQIFRSNSPYVLLTTLAAGSPGFTAHSYRDVGAPLASTYKVTVYYANSLGKASGSGDPASVPGFDQLNGVQSDAAKQDAYTKIAYVVGIVLLAILVLVLVVVLVRRRGRAQAAPAYTGGDVGYVAPPAEAAPDPAPAAPAGPTHTVNCPVCKTQFEAVGEKPLRMRCPNCGREGILR